MQVEDEDGGAARARCCVNSWLDGPAESTPADGSPPNVVVCLSVWPQDARPRWVRVEKAPREEPRAAGQALLWVVLMVLMGNGGGRRAEVIGPC